MLFVVYKMNFRRNHTFHNDDSGSRELTGKMGEAT